MDYARLTFFIKTILNFGQECLSQAQNSNMSQVSQLIVCKNQILGTEALNN